MPTIIIHHAPYNDLSRSVCATVSDAVSVLRDTNDGEVHVIRLYSVDNILVREYRRDGSPLPVPGFPAALLHNLVAEALFDYSPSRSDQLDDYIAERGFEDWMLRYSDDGEDVTDPDSVIRDLSAIYKLTRKGTVGLRQSLGLTQAQLSDRFGIPKRTIENWEAGKSSIPPYTLCSLLEAADVLPWAVAYTEPLDLSKFLK